MEKYRIYKKALSGNFREEWEKTSFLGDRKTITGIIQTLSKSKYHMYEMVLSYNY